MKTLYALVHKSDNTIIKIVETAKRQEDKSILIESFEKNFNTVEKTLSSSVVESNSAENLSIVKFQWDEITNTIGKATPEVGKTVTLNVEMTPEMFWKSANNGLKFVNNKLV